MKILPKISQNLDKLSKIEDNTDDPEAIAQALTDINDTIKLVIPELPDEVELNVDQATALIDFILKMITPPEAKKLAEQGISPSSKKKIGSVS